MQVKGRGNDRGERGRGEEEEEEADLQALKKIGGEIVDACKRFGFFYISNHGIPGSLVSDLVEDSTRFFAMPLEYKNRISMKHRGLQWRGYFAVGEELTGRYSDNKEGIYFGENYPAEHPKVLQKTPMHGQNLFPPEAEFPNFSCRVEDYMEKMTNLGHKLLRAIAVGLGLEKDFFFLLAII